MSSFVSTIPKPSQSVIFPIACGFMTSCCPYTKLPPREMQRKPSACGLIEESKYPSRSQGIKDAESGGKRDKALKAFSTIF